MSGYAQFHFVYYHLVFAQTLLVPEDAPGSVKFEIKNFGLTVEGFFEELQGKIVWDGIDMENSSFDVSPAGWNSIAEIMELAATASACQTKCV